MNQWEEHFQRYVAGRHFPLHCERIPEGKAKRPDFEISADKLPHKIVVEVKTLSPNAQDKRLRKGAEEYAEQVRQDPSTEPQVEVYIRSMRIPVQTGH